MATIKATPRMRYLKHKTSAKRRGIEFKLTFEEWWAIWAPHYESRGTSAGQMQMCRTGDVGPYASWNVRIDTVEANRAEAKYSGQAKAEIRDWGEPRPDARFWVHDRLGMFSKSPLKIMIEDEQEDEKEGETY